MRRGAEGVNFIGYSLGHYYVFGRHRPGARRPVGRLPRTGGPSGLRPRRRRARGREPRAARRQGRARAGRADCAARWARPTRSATYLRRYEECGVDQVILSCAAGRNRHEHIMETLELFGREVMPEFVERDERRQREKAERLAPVIDAVMARKPAGDHPPLDPDYEIPAYPRLDADQPGEREVPPLARRLRRQASPPAKTSASGSPEAGCFYA